MLKKGRFSGDVAQRKFPSASSAIHYVSLGRKTIAELALGNLRVSGFCENARLPERLAGFREFYFCNAIGREGNR